ncbi:hypothetical protein PAXRUDRAFT_835394, partial [Paxillus rubicundulus Ve08.2h10]
AGGPHQKLDIFHVTHHTHSAFDETLLGDQVHQDIAGSRKQSLKSHPALTYLTKQKCDGTT